MIAHPSGAQVNLIGVQRTFPESGPVIETLDLAIARGEFVSLLGPSGCGKSTLLRLIAGLDRADQGRIEIEASGAKHFKAFVFQESHLLPWRTVLQNTVLPLELMGTPKVEARERALDALERVGLADSLQRFPNQLSGGMKMRVSVARALVTRPSLFLLDEPFAALDESTRHRLQEDLRALWESLKMTVVFVTHSVSEAVFLSNRAVVLSKRPARILLNHQVEMQEKRDKTLRTSPAFIEQMKLVYEAFEAGGTL